MQPSLPLVVLVTATLSNALPSIPDNVGLGSSYPSGPCPWTHERALTHDEVISNYYRLWAGDMSYLERTVVPSFSLWQDRLPTGNTSIQIPVNSAKEMGEFVKLARQDFLHYEFVDQFHFGVGNMVVTRWALNGTYGGSPNAKLPKGSHVTYNGTDLALLDPCTGKMQQVLSAQDSIAFSHALQRPIGIV